ncbi:MAG: hypothetical protein HC836_23195 [Richelia sp. RM2_1_2]|nr:hypothetical protein [Richelia sp. RM2_1_2]
MNVVKEFPVKAFIVMESWYNDPRYAYLPDKDRAATKWIKEQFGYDDYPYKCICNVMQYVVFRFRNEADAVYFKLVWAYNNGN